MRTSPSCRTSSAGVGDHSAGGLLDGDNGDAGRFRRLEVAMVESIIFEPEPMTKLFDHHPQVVGVHREFEEVENVGAQC